MFIIIGYFLYICKFSYTILSLGICITLLHCVCGGCFRRKRKKKTEWRNTVIYVQPKWKHLEKYSSNAHSKSCKFCAGEGLGILWSDILKEISITPYGSFIKSYLDNQVTTQRSYFLKTSKAVRYREQELLFYYKCCSTFVSTVLQIILSSIPIQNTLQLQPDPDWSSKKQLMRMAMVSTLILNYNINVHHIDMYMDHMHQYPYTEVPIQ